MKGFVWLPYRLANGIFTNEYGEDSDDIPWDSSQPSGNVGEDCVAMSLTDKLAHDVDCTNENNFFCKVESTLNLNILGNIA